MKARQNQKSHLNHWRGQEKGPGKEGASRVLTFWGPCTCSCCFKTSVRRLHPLSWPLFLSGCSRNLMLVLSLSLFISISCSTNAGHWKGKRGRGICCYCNCLRRVELGDRTLAPWFFSPLSLSHQAIFLQVSLKTHSCFPASVQCVKKKQLACNLHSVFKCGLNSQVIHTCT